MRCTLNAPARINLLGNPSDANEGDFATISAAIDIRAGVSLEPAEGLVLEAADGLDAATAEMRLEFRREEHPLPYDGRLDLLKAAFNRLHDFSDEFRSRFASGGVRVTTWTDVPYQSGLGGSSLLAILTLAGLREFYGLDRRVHNDYVIAELTQRVESKELGITCGFADRYVPIFGGIAYIDYRGKLNHSAIGQEPYATYERLDEWVETMPLVLVSTGVERDSGDVHGTMRPRYLEEHEEWERRGGTMPPMVHFMRAAWETAWRGKAALLKGDLATVGGLINENHRVVDRMMTYCGFEDGAGWANNMLIDAALESGAIGAKLTGAGSGGSVFALTLPGNESRVAKAWERKLAGAGLESASISRPRISRRGLVIQVG